ncbi:rRNA biogenesis protein rrp36 [Coemansia sp. RSA 2611]|nr:rRNA biogenesis protein rrp36 [Coemansia sp. RSA 2611]
MAKSAKTIEQYSSDEDSEQSHFESSDEEQQYSGSDSGSESDGDAEAKHRAEAARIRAQLADVPFDQLIRIQRQMAPKKPNALGQKEKLRVKRETKRALKRRVGADSQSSDSDASGSESDNSAPETISTKPSGPQKAGGQDFHRDSRKMPAIMNSKRPVGRFRQVVDMPKPKSRDPRFDNLSGHFNEDLFEKSYEFLEKQRQEEMGEMKRRVAALKSKDPREAKRVQRALESMQSQAAAKQQQKRAQALKRTHRKMEMDAVKQGKKPYFLGKRDLKEMEVAQKFNQLKGSAKLDKFLEKRRKHNASKDHRGMPHQRRDD